MTMQEYRIRIIIVIILTVCVLNSLSNDFNVKGNNEEVVFTEIAQLSTDGRTDFIEIVEGFVFIFDFEEGFFVYDIHNPWKPKLLDSLNYSNYYDPRVHGGHDFVIQGSMAIINFIHSGIKIVNITDPYNLEVIGSYDSGGEYYHIDVINHLIYCAKAEAGLEILDISIPSKPAKVGTFSNGHGLHFVHVHNQIAYIGDLDQKSTLCLNVTDPSNVTEMNQLDGLTREMIFVDDLAYVGLWEGNDGLLIYNISDPIQPVLVSNLYDGGKVYDIKVRENYLFIADHSDGLEIIDIQDPVEPVEIAQWNDGGECIGFDVYKNLMIMAEYSNGWEIVLIEGLDLGEISSITESTSGWAMLISVSTLMSIIICGRKKKIGFV